MSLVKLPPRCPSHSQNTPRNVRTKMPLSKLSCPKCPQINRFITHAHTHGSSNQAGSSPTSSLPLRPAPSPYFSPLWMNPVLPVVENPNNALPDTSSPSSQPPSPIHSARKCIPILSLLSPPLPPASSTPYTAGDQRALPPQSLQMLGSD